MAKQKVVYTNPKEGTPLMSTISTGCRTPRLTIKFCSLKNPFRYPNSPQIPRYSVTCSVDPEIHKEFLKGIQSIEKAEAVETIVKIETAKVDGKHVQTGNVLVKFQTKEIIPVYLMDGKNEPEEMELEDELGKEENIEVIYDILRFTQKNSTPPKHGITFKPTAIYYYPNAKSEE